LLVEAILLALLQVYHANYSAPVYVPYAIKMAYGATFALFIFLFFIAGD